MSTKDSSGKPKFPPPCSISDRAQGALAIAPANGEYPSPAADAEVWHRHIAAHNEAIGKMLALQPAGGDIQAAWEDMGGVPVVRAIPAQQQSPAGKVYLDIHGGALIYLGGEYVRSMAIRVAEQVRSPVVSVDYRMPPDHPFPSALNDCFDVYTSLLAEVGADNLIVGGSSAGGNLAAALLLRARDEGVAMPAGLVLLSPEVDLTESGDTFQTLLGADRMGSHMPVNLLYANGRALDDPYLSPLFGDLSGFPPTFLQSGTRDLFLSNTVRMHRALRKAGVEAELHVWEAMPHGGFLGAPEDEELNVELRQFMARRW